MFTSKNGHHGFTLIELLVYTALIVIFSWIVSSFFIKIIRINLYSQATEEVLASSQRAMNVIMQEIQHASGFYYPTSIFDTHPGQLGLATTRELITGEDVTYVDFYVDNGGLYMKREGESAKLLTSERVRVDNFVINHLNIDDAYPVVRVLLTIVYNSPATDIEDQSRITLTSTASLRSY